MPRKWYASNSGTDACNQAMIADENDPAGRTIAVLYDRKDAPFIVKACNEYDQLRELACDLMQCLEDSTYLTSDDFFTLRERFRDLIHNKKEVV